MAPKTPPTKARPTPPKPKAAAAAKKGPRVVNGFPPSVWGAQFWFVMHVVAAAYPDNPSAADKANYAKFYESLAGVLPCPGCQEGYRRIIATEPTKLSAKTFTNRESVFRWTSAVHNRVNEKLGKPIHASWEDWLREYDRLRG